MAAKKGTSTPQPLDGELTSSFMAKKQGELVNRQKSKVSAKAEAFTFTPSFASDGGASASAPEQQHSSSQNPHRRPPDNFDMSMNDGKRSATAGGYFKTRTAMNQHQQQQRPESGPNRPHNVTVTDNVQVAGAQSQPAHSFKSRSRGSFSMGKSSARLPPLDRQAELEEAARQRALQALAEQEEEDRLKREACEVQRQVERLKMQQRVKARIEKQLLSSQRPLDKSVVNMGIDVEEILNRPKEATLASQHRAALKDEPNAAFIHYNMNRMMHNQAHRQYCLQTLQERQRMRMALESHCHAFYPRHKEKQLKAIGADTTGACRFPTVAEMHAQQQAAHNHHKTVQEENDVIHHQTKEVAQRDEDLWRERCDRFDKGLKAEKVRELPYDVNRPYVKRKDIGPSHSPAKIKASGEAK